MSSYAENVRASALTFSDRSTLGAFSENMPHITEVINGKNKMGDLLHNFK